MENASESPFDLVAMVASAGGLQAFAAILAHLPADFPLPVVIMLHMAPDRESHLASLLSSRTELRVKQVESGDRPTAGTVHVAPPGHHLIIRADGRLDLSDAPAVHFARPSADVLLESVAERPGGRALAVILTGAGSDGAEGARAVARAGGTVIVQDPGSAEFQAMPAAALRAVGPGHAVPLERIAPRLVELAGESLRP